MRTSNRVLGVAALLSWASCALVPAARAGTTPLGSSFTYQGLLKSGGAAYSGAADFQFTLWEVPAGNPQVGAMLPVNAVSVTEGVFTTALDFGVLAFDGNERWLQIAVRTPAGGAGGFTTLTPRQRLAAAPVPR